MFTCTLYARFIGWVLELLHRRIRQAQTTQLDHILVRLCPHVFNPHIGRTTGFFIRHMKIPPNVDVLELGTGTGAIAAAAAQRATRVIATDINPQAVRCAQNTMQLNGITAKVKVIQGDLFDPVAGQKFDVILFNPPYLARHPTNQLAKAWFAGSQCQLIARFLREGHNYLAHGGRIQILLSSAAPLHQIFSMIREQNYQIHILSRGRILNFLESVFLVELR